jgi:hypothetical protein
MRINVQMSLIKWRMFLCLGRDGYEEIVSAAKQSHLRIMQLRSFGTIKNYSVSCTFIRGLRVSLTVTHRLKSVICAGTWMFVFRTLS